MARIGLALAALGAAAVLTACSGDDDFAESPAEDIVAAAKSDMDELDAVKVSGTVTSEGDEITIDMQSGSEGTCTGTIAFGDGSAEILGVDGGTWMRPDEAFWRTFAGASAEQVLGVVGDKWVVIPEDEDSFNQFCDIDDLLDEMLKDEDDGSTYTTTGTDELDGQDVVLVDNEDPDSGTSTGYVLVDEPHYLVKVEKTEGEDTGSVTFSAFDEEFDVEAPAEDEVIDLESMGT